MTSDEQKLMEVEDLIFRYAGIDGGHHKQWLIDQIIKAIKGSDYEEWIKTWESGEDGPKTYEWDEGIPP